MTRLDYLIQTTNDKKLLHLLNLLWWKRYFEAQAKKEKNGK